MCRANDALINYNKVRVARADHALRVCKPVHVNRDPAAIHEDEVRVPDQSEMVRPVSLDEELFRMPPKTEHLAMTRSELFLVHRRRLIRVHVRLARARMRTRLIPVYVRSATLNVCLSTYVRPGLRFCLRFALLLSGMHLLPFCRRSSLRFFRLPLRCCGSSFVWPSAINGNATAVIAVIITILIVFPFTLCTSYPQIFGPVDKSGFCRNSVAATIATFLVCPKSNFLDS